MDNKPIIHLTDRIFTDYSGIKRLFEFYHNARQYYNTTIYLDFYHLDWFDANLSALFGCILSKLNSENNLVFSTDLNFLEEKFNVLFRNGFLNSDKLIIDEHQSTVSFQNFNSTDKVGFVNYIENDLLKHRGMPPFSEDLKESILMNLIEVYNNIQIHSKSNEDFYVCGQYYPSKEVLIFTLVDVGIGFLPAIKLKTNDNITDNYSAILWALEKGNSTKLSCPGGLGLSDLYNYFKSSNGDLQIITGDTFWAIELENTVIKSYNFKSPFVGSILNLVFRYK